MTSQLVSIHTPGLKWFLNHLENEFESQASLQLYINALKRRSVRNPTPCAFGTAHLLLRLVSHHKDATVQGLVPFALNLETELSAARPREMAIRNMVRRLLGVIREESQNLGLEDLFEAAMRDTEEDEDDDDVFTPNKPPTPVARTLPRIPLLSSHTSFHVQSAQVTSLFSSLASAGIAGTRPTTPKVSPLPSGIHTPDNNGQISQAQDQRKLRSTIIEDIQDLIEELENCDKNINDLAPSLIHRHEVIMTYGLPSTLHKFLLRAAVKNPDFTLIVVEGNPNIMHHTHGTVMNKIPIGDESDDATQSAATKKSLQERGVQVVVISDADIFNFISRVNKVFIQANYVLCNGAVVAAAGTSNLAYVAQTMKKPVIAIAGTHQLCPAVALNKEDLIEMGPSVTVRFNEGELVDHADSPNPLTDYIDPGTVAYFATNNGLLPAASLQGNILQLYHMPEADLV
ncbi:nagb/rpia/CoA transferase-like protein [Ascodesmis nigricans]|uniref:Translation initiation factor eIF2B subunit beta n=1 Tax=Ascodesmis nigricans TaxID=341454 RepID=A0A4S2N513_9PEZI|nr:nagb/rpia/CoA transferase-like protein [Ascodesmis nigricans]